MNLVNSFNAKNLDNVPKVAGRKNHAGQEAIEVSDEETDLNRFLNQNHEKEIKF